MLSKQLKQIVMQEGKPKIVNQVVKEALSESAETLDIYLYDVIQGDFYDWTEGERKESETSANAVKKILGKNPNVKHIRLFVNSQGGSVFEAMGIRAHLLRHGATKTAYVDGWAASAASFILTACDEVKMLEGSLQMLHSMWTWVSGNAKELRHAADVLDKMMAANRKIYLGKTKDKLDEATLIKLMDDETWLTAEECLECGLCDVVMTASAYTDETAQEPKELGTETEQPEIETVNSSANLIDDIKQSPPQMDGKSDTPATGQNLLMTALLKAAERNY